MICSSGTIQYAESKINPAFNVLKNTDIVNLRIEPLGSEQIDQKQKEIRCQNGSNECKANTFMKCSISSYPDPEDYLKLIGCSFQKLFVGGKPVEQPEKAFLTCALKHGLDFSPIDICYDNEKKKSEQPLRSILFTPFNKTCLPHVEVNNELIDNSKSLADEICKAYLADVLKVDGKAPKECIESNVRTRTKFWYI